jgi:hypothetical protein
MFVIFWTFIGDFSDLYHKNDKKSIVGGVLEFVNET